MEVSSCFARALGAVGVIGLTIFVVMLGPRIKKAFGERTGTTVKFMLVPAALVVAGIIAIAPKIKIVPCGGQSAKMTTPEVVRLACDCR